MREQTATHVYKRASATTTSHPRSGYEFHEDDDALYEPPRLPTSARRYHSVPEGVYTEGNTRIHVRHQPPHLRPRHLPVFSYCMPFFFCACFCVWTARKRVLACQPFLYRSGVLFIMLICIASNKSREGSAPRPGRFVQVLLAERV